MQKASDKDLPVCTLELGKLSFEIRIGIVFSLLKI
jgi:hypothetical protein